MDEIKIIVEGQMLCLLEDEALSFENPREAMCQMVKDLAVAPQAKGLCKPGELVSVLRDGPCGPDERYYQMIRAAAEALRRIASRGALGSEEEAFLQTAREVSAIEQESKLRRLISLMR